MEVTAALVAALERFIHLPRDYVQTARRFSKFGFPNTVGAIDGTHITINAPKDHKGGIHTLLYLTGLQYRVDFIFAVFASG